MSEQIRVPDIGDFKNVPVIEVHVIAGSIVNAEDPLITLEGDKATLDIPSPRAGTIESVDIKVGDRVSEGAHIATFRQGDPAVVSTTSAVPAEHSKVSPGAEPRRGAEADIDCEVVVVGAGPGGYSAAFRAADLGQRTVLVERWPDLGGVCLNVGCIPSKALLHTTSVIDEASALAAHGVTLLPPSIDLAKLRQHKDQVVGKLTSGLAGMAQARKVSIVRGTARFIDSHRLKVEQGDESRTISFEKAIIAVGSEAVRLPFIPQDPRIIDSTGALELRSIPKKMLVVGGGIIGLEMATVYSTLGSRLEVVEMLDGLMVGADRDLVKVWQKKNAHRFDAIMLKTKTVSVEPNDDGIYVSFEGDNAPTSPQRYDMVLVAAGRSPNGKLISAENAGVRVDERGFIPVDQQMRTQIPHIFAIGDVAGPPMLAHKAVHEGHVAAESAAGKASFNDARQIPSVAYTDPEIAWTGVTEDQAIAKGVVIAKAIFPWAASGRAIANGRDEGMTKLIFDRATHRLIGGGIVGTHAGDLIGEVCLAIEMGADATDIGKTIHPHPTLSETVGLAAEVSEGVCTDLPHRQSAF